MKVIHSLILNPLWCCTDAKLQEIVSVRIVVKLTIAAEEVVLCNHTINVSRTNTRGIYIIKNSLWVCLYCM